MNRRSRSVTVLQATQDTPALARLTELATESTARLKAIQPLIPAALRAAIQAGPIDGTTWCLILDNSAVAAKVPAVTSRPRVALAIQRMGGYRNSSQGSNGAGQFMK